MTLFGLRSSENTVLMAYSDSCPNWVHISILVSMCIYTVYIKCIFVTVSQLEQSHTYIQPEWSFVYLKMSNNEIYPGNAEMYFQPQFYHQSKETFGDEMKPSPFPVHHTRRRLPRFLLLRRKEINSVFKKLLPPHSSWRRFLAANKQKKKTNEGDKAGCRGLPWCSSLVLPPVATLKRFDGSFLTSEKRLSQETDAALWR